MSILTNAARPWPTLGGKQLWRDRMLHAGWRLQENVTTGRHRLLDPRDRRWAAGAQAVCRDRFEALRRERHIAPASNHLVLMLHGIARSTGTFRVLRRRLAGQGFDAAAISYPSTRATIEAHAEGLAHLLDGLEGTCTVSFVTHSMGGLVLRHLLARDRAWQRRLSVGRIVLIAPPNQGAAMAARLKNFPPYRLLYGPAGQQLVPEAVRAMPGLDGHEFGIVAGGRGDGRGYNPLLAGDDDGTVALAETPLAGAQAACLVRGRHFDLANRPAAVRAATEFLEHGRFSAASEIAAASV